MSNERKSRVSTIFIAVPLLALFASLISIHPLRRASASPAPPPPDKTQLDPWTPAETVQPAELVREIANARPATRPLVVCVGFRVLYDGAHVPGASFHGPASTTEGLADLRRWAQAVPRSANVVLYCGCCPLAHCPNIRPAFSALHDMGFTHLRVLLLPNDFATDWVAKGYPTTRGS